MMLNPILSFSAIRRMRSFRTMLIVIAYVTALLLAALTMLSGFIRDDLYLNMMQRGPLCHALLLAAQFLMLVLIAPAMTSGSIAGERERQTLDLLLVTNTGSFRIVIGKMMESFAMLALLILCGLPVMSLCLLTGGVSLGQILIGELFLLAEAFACVSIGVFCSSLSRSTVFSGVISCLVILGIGALLTLPLLPLRSLIPAAFVDGLKREK
jgi:ABC-type transport system involved in multi-copper enzyme maturation permease subunit